MPSVPSDFSSLRLCLLQGPIYKSIEWLDKLGMEIIVTVKAVKGSMPFA